jgi:hypothetical protein
MSDLLLFLIAFKRRLPYVEGPPRKKKQQQKEVEEEEGEVRSRKNNISYVGAENHTILACKVPCCKQQQQQLLHVHTPT